ncbi:NlpC/P60 family protein [Chthonobacter albigriseus]|uniref:NlpC/P60 family protein n=1 Tax=Chthonobacter albigriseus TaxID=1683161 RepID=UPI0015EF9343|nr:NlpC/P60 family protein [Chthonobacter albigriseus]
MTPTREMIVAEARSWLGTPYRHQASLKGVGCDCLGLVRGIWRAFHGAEPEPLPAYAPDWAEATGGDSLMAAARRWLVERDGRDFQPGDVILFRYRENLPAKHAAVWIGDGRFIHAHDGAVVSEGTLGPWWARRVAGVFGWPGVG